MKIKYYSEGEFAMHRLFFIVVTVLVFFVLDFHLSFAYEKEIKSLSSTMVENIAKAARISRFPDKYIFAVLFNAR